MANIESCPFDNYDCLCRVCENKCYRFDCLECKIKGEPTNIAVYCLGFKGDFNAYRKLVEEKFGRKGEE